MKHGIMALVVCAVCSTGFAQKASLGVNGGFGHAWMSNYLDKKFKPAANLGVAFVYSSESRFGFGADLKYSVEGGKAELGNDKKVTSLDYIRLPLKALYFFGKPGQRIRPKLGIGPSVGFLIGGDTEISRTNPAQQTNYKAKDLYQTVDIGLAASAGIHYRIRNLTWFTAELASYSGFRNIVKNPSFGSLSFPNSHRNNNISLNVGVNWGL